MHLDDFPACQITRTQDWMNASAFSEHYPFGSKLHALYSAGIGSSSVQACSAVP